MRSLCCALLLSLTACQPSAPDTAADEVADSALPPLPRCPSFAPPEVVGTVANTAITEASGLVASADGATLYTHNDSGDANRFFALRSDGAARGSWELPTVAADIEDIALSDDVVYLADMGDNAKLRAYITIYGVARPAPDRTDSAQTIDADVYEFTYPDGPHDAEALLVEQGSVTILTKEDDGISGIYSAPLQPGTRGALSLLGSVDLGANGATSLLLTGADLRADGVILRTYVDVLVFRRVAGMSIAGALATDGCAAPAPVEAQGEAVAWVPEGFMTVSEGSQPSVFLVRQLEQAR